MFLPILEEQEKPAFLALAQNLVSADGTISEEEATMLNVMRSEMQYFDVVPENTNIENLCGVFHSKQSKNATLLELVGISYADSEFSEEELKLIKKIAGIFEIPESKIQEYAQWVENMLKLTNDGYKLVNE
jgi:uncharacterized tellurite resistance protein B-like protein